MSMFPSDCTIAIVVPGLPLPPLLMIASSRDATGGSSRDYLSTNSRGPPPQPDPLLPSSFPSEFCDHQVQSCAMWTLNKCSAGDKTALCGLSRTFSPPSQQLTTHMPC